MPNPTTAENRYTFSIVPDKESAYTFTVLALDRPMAWRRAEAEAGPDSYILLTKVELWRSY